MLKCMLIGLFAVILAIAACVVGLFGDLNFAGLMYGSLSFFSAYFGAMSVYMARRELSASRDGELRELTRIVPKSSPKSEELV